MAVPNRWASLDRDDEDSCPSNRGGQLRILKLRECPLEQLITSSAYASQGRIEPDVGHDADHVVLRASIVAGDAHTRECESEPAGRGEGDDVAVCAGRGASDDRGQLPVLHVPHYRFRVANCAAVREKHAARGKLRGGWL